MRWVCLPCDAVSSKTWRDANPEKARKSVRTSLLMRRYGITPEELAQMKQEVGYICGICGRVPNQDSQRKEDRTLHIDHRHPEGFERDKRLGSKDEIRGFLCGPCNRRLGWYETYRTEIEGYLNGR